MADIPVTKQIGAVGAGRMGRGIALAFAYAGYPVALIDLKPRDHAAFDALMASARVEITRDLQFLTRVGALQADDIDAVLGCISFVGHQDAAATLSKCDVVFEGVPETVAAKTECFAIVSQHVRPDCMVASTTSTIDAETLAPLVVHPERFLNAHWLNPAHLMPLVELSPSQVTDPDVTQKLRGLLTKIGKVPIVCKSSPGYIVPRIQALAMNEAARLVEEGVATAEDIDTAVRVGFGLRFAVLGLLEFIDWGGGDILHHASAFLSDRLDPQRFVAPDIVQNNMKDQRRGLRDGVGFYDYGAMDTDAYRDQRLASFVALLQHRNLMPKRPDSEPSQ